MTPVRRVLTAAIVFVLVMSLFTGIAAAGDYWKDWPNGFEMQAEEYVSEEGLLYGYTDGTYKPYLYITERQVVKVCVERGGLREDLNWEEFYNTPATMGWIEENFLPDTVHSAGPEELATRIRLAIMLERNNGNTAPRTEVEPSEPSEEAIISQRLNQWFEQTIVNGKQSRLVGTGELFVQLSREFRVPIWLALGQCWRESQFFTTGLAGKGYNCGWGIKDSAGKYGAITGTVAGFANYISVEEAIRAYFRVMNNDTYRPLVDSGQWRRILNIYAPSYENNTRIHYATVMCVKGWCEDRGIW